MIRILHLIGSSQPGGVETFVTSLAEEIDRKRFSLSVCILDDEGPVAERLRALRVPVTSIGKGPPSIARFISLLRTSEVDILHASTGGRLYRRIAVLAGVSRVIVHVHGPQPGWVDGGPVRNKLRSEFDASVAHATRAIVCAEWIARLLSESGIRKLPPVHVVRYGVEAPRLENREEIRAAIGIPAEAIVIGFIGRLTEQKGIEDLADVISQVTEQRDDVVFLVVGDGPLMPFLRDLEARAGTSQLHITGWSDDPFRMLAAMDIVAMPSRWEGLSIAHLEAMAAGKPVVGYAIDGLLEASEPGTTGCYVAPGDRRAFADELIALVENPDKRLTMGRAAMEKAASEFRADRMAREIERIYDSVGGSSQ